MEDMEKKFFDYYVSNLVYNYGVDVNEAKEIAKMVKKYNRNVWDNLFNAWFDNVHPY